MRNRILAILSLGLMMSAAQAQQAPQSQPNGQGNRPGMGRGGPGFGGPGGDMAAWFLRDVDENVGLSGQQKKDLEESINKLRDEAIEQFRNNPPNPEMRQSFRDMRQQLEQAAQAGDDAKVQEIQKQMESSGPASTFRQMRSRAMDEVAKSITADQQEAFEQWRTLRESNLPPPLLNNPDSLKEALKSISTLTDAQTNSLEAAFQRYDSQMSAPGISDEPLQQNKIRNNLIASIQRTLKPGQQVLMMSNFRQQMMQQWRQRNTSQPASQTSSAQEAAVVPPASAQQQAAPQTSPRPANVQDSDAWAAYVRTFITQHHLDELATGTANDILQELRGRRDVYLASHRTDMEQIDKKAQLAGSVEERAAIQQERDALQKPVADMFQELKDRLNVLAPATASQSAGTQPATASRPGASSRPAQTQALRTIQPAASQSAQTIR